MTIITLVEPFNGENTYCLDAGDAWIVIDPGVKAETLRQALGDKPCLAVLLTHAHFDHIVSVAALQRAGAKVYMHRADAENLHGRGNLADLFCERLDEFEPDVWWQGAETDTKIGDLPVRVLATPGHTAGSVCYVIGDTVFSGDTLFRDAVGRSDFPTGNGAQLIASIRDKLFVLPDYRVLPGHGQETTIEQEKKYNPYV